MSVLLFGLLGCNPKPGPAADTAETTVTDTVGVADTGETAVPCGEAVPEGVELIGEWQILPERTDRGFEVLLTDSPLELKHFAGSHQAPIWFPWMENFPDWRGGKVLVGVCWNPGGRDAGLGLVSFEQEPGSGLVETRWCRSHQTAGPDHTNGRIALYNVPDDWIALGAAEVNDED